MSKTLTVKVLMDARTEDEWLNSGQLVIPKGYMAVSLFDDGKSLVKIGNGVGTWTDLPYINEAETIDLSNYYTKEETEAKIAESVSELGTIFRLKGRLTSSDELPETDNEVGDMYLVGAENQGDLIEYYWTGTFWDYMGTTMKVDLSDYYTKTQTDEKISAAIEGIDLSHYIKDTDVLILTNVLEG